ncbi:MAG: radical SAM family heme chaperone HemW [bacterium]|nr:radical SAM family heme chaperone HemW [bacterium]
MMEKIGIYIHIPFCKRLCHFCHFVKTDYENSALDRYIDALTKEISLRRDPGYVIDSIFFGGGSPSLLDERQMSTVIQSIYENFSVDPKVECTVEMNPDDIDDEKLGFLRKLGVNRLSIGTQSFVSRDLDYLRRTHDKPQTIAAVEKVLEGGFDNFNIDFIISLPSQTRESLAGNFLTLSHYDIPHISAYILEGVDESQDRDIRDHDLYFLTNESLDKLGYVHYEVSNYSKPGFQSRHNLKYWRNKDYIGAGLSASGFEKGVDYKNVVKFNQYYEKLDANQLPHGDVTPPNASLRKIIMGLRLVEGIPADDFSNYPEALDLLLSNRMLIWKEGRIAINPDKMLLLNEILTYFA